MGLLQVTEARRVRGSGRRDPDRADDVLRETHALRLGLYRVLTGSEIQRTFRGVARLAEEAAAAARLLPADRDSGTAEWVIPASAGMRLPLLRVAQAAGDLLANENRRRVRRCPGDDCGWLFLDRSGRRKWCSMQSCGNRATVRAYEERRRAKASL